MNSFARAVLGAGFGALLTLGLHPTSRPFLTTLLLREQPSELAAQLHLRSERLPTPTGLPEAALWMHMASDRLEGNKPLRPNEVRSLLKILAAADGQDHDNAYWPQMKAVILAASGNKKAAEDEWIRASKRQGWNDYQSDLLKEARHRIRASVGSEQAWQSAYVYYARSESSAKRIERLARSLISDIDGDSPKTLDLRYATLKNGSLLRDGSRSVLVGLRGANVVELASYPRGLMAMRSPKRLLLAQIAMYNALAGSGQVVRAASVLKGFQDNDAWRALTNLYDYSNEASNIGALSLLTASLPSALLLCGLVGCIVWSLGRLMDRGRGRRLEAPLIALLALGLGFLTLFLSQNVFAAVVTALCASFLSYGIDRGRTQPSEDLGPLYSFLIAVLASVFTITFVLYVTAFSLPSTSLAPLIGLPGEFFGNRSMFIGLSAIVFGLVLLSASFWSIVQRRGIAMMLSLSMRRFGAMVGWTGLALACLASPLCIYWDRQLEGTLNQLLDNEPVYHLLR